MRSLQLLVLALLATAAWADNVPFFNYFYDSSLGLEFPGFTQDEGPVRTFDLAAQPANGFFYSDIAPNFPNFDFSQVTWDQVSSNNRGEALGNLPAYLLTTSVLMGPTGEIFPVTLFAVFINDNGIILTNGIDGPFLADASAIEANGRAVARMLPEIMSPDIISNVFNNHVTGFVEINGINDLNQVFVTGDGISGVLSPFAVPEPSTLLLLASICVGLVLFRRTRHSGHSSS
jgi:hypothetical protein